MKKILSIVLIAVIGTVVFAAGKKEKKVIASTSWTAAFVDIAGVKTKDAIAPASLRHPPEYEITVSDIQKISSCDVFVFAGFERMMKTLGTSVGNVEMVKIHCNNSIETVSTECRKLAKLFGTEKECEKRLAEYVDAITKTKAELEKNGYAGAKVLCNVNQIYLAKDLGFEVADTFGPGPVTSEQIAKAKSNDYVFIIDNVHNPVAKPLVEVSPDSKYVIWRNFPEKVEPKALLKVVQGNIKLLK